MPRERFATIVHPSAVVARDAQIGAGCAIMANSVVCSEARIDDHVIMLQNSSINHHARLGAQRVRRLIAQDSHIPELAAATGLHPTTAGCRTGRWGAKGEAGFSDGTKLQVLHVFPCTPAA